MIAHLIEGFEVNALLLMVGLVCGTLLGALAGFSLGTRDRPNPIDFYTNELGIYLSLLYESNGTPRNPQWIRDALAVRMANALILAGNLPPGTGISNSQASLKTLVARVLEQDLLAGVKQYDARELASQVARCVMERDHQNGICPTDRSGNMPSLQRGPSAKSLRISPTPDGEISKPSDVPGLITTP
ncbi:hypothetical protein [Stenotrophomonas sp. TWI819]|uniref:hypothetical protein n=1 Tax=Stenotrophomonas sp. TWI819 TaxID=3136800 RepID=UPI0032081B5F